MKKVLAIALTLGALTGAAYAQGYPHRNITMIVPFPAGGPSDVVARIMADGMGKHLGQTVVVENVGGAGGTLGTGRAAASDADGYTILAASMGPMVSAPAFYPNLKYDPAKDFAAIGLSANASAAIVAKNDFPAKDLKEFIDYVKKNGASVKQAHGGVGASSHMACLLFTSQLGIKPQLVPYRGTGPALNDLVGGHVDFFCEQVVSVAAAIKGGKIKAYAVSDDERSPALPDVPSAKEAGDAQYMFNIWSGIYAPKGTPKEAVDKLADALNKTLDDPETTKKLIALGGTVPPKAERGPDHLAKILKDDIARWDPILKEAAASQKQN
ncbi:MAG: Bug family tripartite tricarboxylate transporter substrate binding protein [Sphingobacteriales bacterium]